MNDNRYPEIGLYYHNADSYDKVKEAYQNGEKVVGIVHATGTGKSFNALQLALDNKDRKIVYVVPSKGIIDHLKEIINSNPNLDFDRDFPNLEFRTYQSFISLEKHEIEDINCDLLILDEFHHIGAPVWGARIDTMIETHPNMRVFGMTAYTVRDRGTSYERNMADPDTEELFSNKIVSRYDLCDAMVEGVLPKPIYKSAYINLAGTADKLEARLSRLNPESKDYKELMPILTNVKMRIHEAPSIPELLQKSLKPDGKYIYFCPPCSEEGANDIETIKKQAMEWFKQMYPDKEVIFYTSTSEMGLEGKQNRDAFYKDVTLNGQDASNKLRIMFAINQYNEGIHAPNIDGVIMGRGTCSDIVFFEQIGRALSVRGNTKDKVDELEKYSIEELIKMCNEKDIPIKEGMTKDNIIEKLISPVIIDLTNNIDFIKDLENRLRDKIRNFNENGLGGSRRILNIDASFDIEMVNEDLYELLRYVMDRLVMTWEDKYELAKAYYEKNKNLFIPYDFKTINGYEYDENGTKLGQWLSDQRKYYKGKSGRTISEERIKLLEEIGMVWGDVHNVKWAKMYNLAKKYYEENGDLLVPKDFKTKNGYKYDENGEPLGAWIREQRNKYSKNPEFNKERIKLLEEIGMVWKSGEYRWKEMYELAKVYYGEYHNLLIPFDFKTKNGKDPDEEGKPLGTWINKQRDDKRKETNSNFTEERIKLLEEIGMVWEPNQDQWLEMYNLAKIYRAENGNLLASQSFKTKNGKDPDEEGKPLGSWISTQRDDKKKGTLTEERVKLLEEIDMVWDAQALKDEENRLNWQRNYELAKEYYNEYHNLLISRGFKTKNGKDPDETGVDLGEWIQRQRGAYKNEKNGKKGGGVSRIKPYQIELLDKIGMIWDAQALKNEENRLRWQHNYELAKAYYLEHGNLLISKGYQTKDGTKLGQWIRNLRQTYKGNNENAPLTEDQIKMLEDIGMVWDASIKKK